MTYFWNKMNIVPQSSLEAWHMYEEGVSSNILVQDYSGHGRHLTVGAGNSPVLTDGIINGLPAWYMNGSRDPLTYTGSVTAKHIFIVASYELAAFPGYKGLLSSLSAGNMLTSNNSGDKFYQFGAGYKYRMADLGYSLDNQKAPMNGTFAVIELVLPGAGSALDGLRVGQEAADTARRWKGWFAELLVYSTEQSDLVRCRLYEYFAMRYKLWQKTASAQNIFPFPSNRSRNIEIDREHYLSDPYSGSSKALIRGDFIQASQWPFALRLQAEYEAAESFHQEHYPLTHFVMRDWRFTPPRDVVSRFSSPLREQGSDVTYRFNYSFDTIEVEAPPPPPEPPETTFVMSGGSFVESGGSIITTLI